MHLQQCGARRIAPLDRRQPGSQMHGLRPLSQQRPSSVSHPYREEAVAAGGSEPNSSELSGLDGLALQHGATVRLVSSKGGHYTVEGVMASAAAPDAVFGLLCDYERVADVFSNVLRSSTYRTIGDDTRLQQVCRWEFLVFSGKFPLELTVAEQPEARRVVFTLASSPFMKSFEGAWQVQERPGGGCSIRHVMAVSPTLSPPRPLAFYTRRVFERQVATIMEDLGRALATGQQ